MKNEADEECRVQGHSGPCVGSLVWDLYFESNEEVVKGFKEESHKICLVF